MGTDTRIEWADHTFNPWIGCTKVSPACDHCYAEVATPTRALRVGWGPHAERRITKRATWEQPFAWHRKAAREGRRPRVFSASLADVFDNAVPIEWLVDLLDIIRVTDGLDWLLLTKRPELIRRRLEASLEQRGGGMHRPALIEWIALWLDGHPPENVWLGATAEDQAHLATRAWHLAQAPGRRRFLSCEPLLGPINTRRVTNRWGTEWDALTGQILCGRGGPSQVGRIHWVIAGGESGPKARPSHPDWFRSLRDQCQAAGVPFFFKQWGEYSYHPIDPKSSAEHLSCIDDQGRDCALSRSTEQDAPWWFLPAGGSRWQERRDIPAGVIECRRVGKKNAGAFLLGREWREVPRG